MASLACFEGGQGRSAAAHPCGLESWAAADAAPCRASTQNPGKLLKKIKKARLAASKGIVKGQKKRVSLQKQGAKAFLKKKKKH